MRKLIISFRNNWILVVGLPDLGQLLERLAVFDLQNLRTDAEG